MLVPAWLRSTSPHHSHNTLQSQQQTHPPRSTQTSLLLQLAASAPLSTARNTTAPDSAHPITQPCSIPPSSLRPSPHAPSPLLGSPRLPLAPRYQLVEGQSLWNGKMTARRPSFRSWRRLRCSWLSAATLMPIRYVAEHEAGKSTEQ